ncbi:glycosyl hydrolase family 17 protein [Pelagicoccus albus]|uniref:Endo-1,3-beta-glucanase btgC n=1 Tax=Pelagicoccus albus TaxID=415222 RepID=A0A7X1B620_9BACT|nr:glycosyl hydrolase family 17 protein [Pelagicoccus albus]MBC2606338.1 glycosyl hydrolase [Pelagicoccus albus]
MKARTILGCLSLIAFTPAPNFAEDFSALEQSEGDLLSGVLRAIAYSGFREGQHPDRGQGANYPTDEQILEDLTILDREGYRLIRLYDSGPNSQDVLRLIEEHDFPIKVMLGIWLSGELSNHEGCEWVTEPVPADTLEANRLKNLEEIEKGVELANSYPETVVAVNVGNESLVRWNDHLVADESMFRYLEVVRSRIQQPVTTADNYKVFSEKGKSLGRHLDFAAVHTYPIWEGVAIDEAMEFTKQNLLEVREALPDLPIVISEAGWASVGSEFGERAGEESQARYLQDLSEFCEENNITLFWFEAFDEPWKGDPGNPMGAEKHWGLWREDRSPKAALDGQEEVENNMEEL